MGVLPCHKRYKTIDWFSRTCAKLVNEFRGKITKKNSQRCGIMCANTRIRHDSGTESKGIAIMKKNKMNNVQKHRVMIKMFILWFILAYVIKA